MKFTLYVIINHPLPSVSDDKKMTYSQPLFEKMDCPPNNDLLKDNISDPTRHDETKFNKNNVVYNKYNTMIM